MRTTLQCVFCMYDVTDITPADTGNYTCEIRGRRSVVLATVTHTVVVNGLSVCLSACLPACLPVCLSACLSAWLPACHPACLSSSFCYSGCLWSDCLHVYNLSVHQAVSLCLVCCLSCSVLSSVCMSTSVCLCVFLFLAL